ncbi:DUF3299 domain-containing protein [Owenweeksia hongkongensis]|uniref:DUF3299 domain-containing protein n=1 Tax=Owenweeksia hongkongensis TaxID=253245 RepID=UPI003A8EDDE5
MRKLALILLFVIASVPSLMAQKSTEIDWKFLSKVDFVDKYFEEYEAWYLFPEFSEPIKKLDGKKVKIKGYVIPLDVEDNLYALSAYPFSSCFFCGGAGPESVMSLKFKGKPRHFDTDDVATFEGTLHLNTTDLDTFNYVLQNAQEVE